MTRQAKAIWIGFLTPVIPGWTYVMVAVVPGFWSDREFADIIATMGVLFVGGGSILLGLLIALGAIFFTRNEPDPLECGKCGYSLVGLTSDRCPECGWRREDVS